MGNLRSLQITVKEENERTNGNVSGTKNNSSTEKEPDNGSSEARRRITQTLTFAALIALIGEGIGAFVAYIRLNQLQAQRESGETNDPIEPSVKITIGAYMATLGSALVFQAAVEKPEEAPQRIVIF